MKNPYTEKENEVNLLLVQAHNIFTEMNDMHPDDTREWVDGIHKCQNVLMRRVVIRDYPNAFYNASGEDQVREVIEETYSIGEDFKSEDSGCVYRLCQVAPSEVCLIVIEGHDPGNRLTDPIKVNSVRFVNEEEFKQISSGYNFKKV